MDESGAKEQSGLREKKRQRTHDALSEAAISLFLARGYDKVSVADIAAAAEVSKPTLFKYFASKEDLVVHRILDHQGEAARVVTDRAAGQGPLAALRGHFLDGLARREPVTGLSDNAAVRAYHGLVLATPTLAARVAQYAARDEDLLAQALIGFLTEQRPEGSTGAGTKASLIKLTARVAASQIIAVHRVLAQDNWTRLTRRRTATQAYPDAVADANHAFDLLDQGLGRYL